MHELWRLATRELTVEQANRHERPGVLPIPYTLMHTLRSEDNAISRYVLGEPALWQQGDWAERVGVSVPDVGRGTPVAEAERLRFRNRDGWRSYQLQIFDRTETALAGLSVERFGEHPFGEALPDWAAGSFLSLVVTPGQPPTLIDLLECFVYQHGIRHLGELEHARAGRPGRGDIAAESRHPAENARVRPARVLPPARHH
jgi:hypothetical protein